MRALLDVNVPIAWLDQDHVHHAAVRNWLSENIGLGWATCPITENGCIRIMSLPAYPNSLPPNSIAERLQEATGSIHHRFWADEVSLLNPGVIAWGRVIGTNQITDVFLLGLAASRGGRPVTLDSGFPVDSIKGTSGHSVVTI